MAEKLVHMKVDCLAVNLVYQRAFENLALNSGSLNLFNQNRLILVNTKMIHISIF